MEVQALIERLEKAEGPDREIDARLCAALYDIPDPPKAFKLGACPPRRPHHDDWQVECWSAAGLVRSYTPANYTASLDAALALVERVLPGWWWSVYCTAGPNPETRDTFTAAVFPRTQVGPPETSRAPTAPLAILIAALKAIADEVP
jgi:hypothetical protein